jgi:hypothetical protein
MSVMIHSRVFASLAAAQGDGQTQRLPQAGAQD